MSDSNPIAASLANAAQSLRDTAKWLVGGVAATAAGVFSGTSLTSLGSLDLNADWPRIEVAGVGVLVGFAGLALIVGTAIRVMNLESITFREFVGSTSNEIEKVRNALLNRYQADIKGQAFSEYILAVDKAYAAEKPTDDQAKLLKRSEDLIPVITADAGFYLVKARFNRLIAALIVGAILSIGGFGAYAWAANPPKPQSPASPSITIPGLRCQ